MPKEPEKFILKWLLIVILLIEAGKFIHFIWSTDAAERAKPRLAMLQRYAAYPPIVKGTIRFVSAWSAKTCKNEG